MILLKFLSEAIEAEETVAASELNDSGSMHSEPSPAYESIVDCPNDSTDKNGRMKLIWPIA